MRDNNHTYDATFGSWRRLLKPFLNKNEVPHVDGHVARLTAVLTRVDEIEGQQASLTAAKQEMSQELKGLVVEGRKIAAFIRTVLRDHHGRKAEKLVEYGLQPFRGNKPAKGEEPVETGEAAFSTTNPAD